MGRIRSIVAIVCLPPAGGVWLGRARCAKHRALPAVMLCSSSVWFASFSSGIGFSCRSQFLAAEPEPFLCPDRSRFGPVHHLIPAILEQESSWLECSDEVSFCRGQAFWQLERWNSHT